MRASPEKPHLAPTKTPSAIEIAWAAGIWEGEGHCRNQRNRSIDVTVVQKDPEILQRLRDWFGGNVRFASCKSVPFERQVYQWEICGDRARLFLAQIYFLLSARRRTQVDETQCLEFLTNISPIELSLQELKERLLAFYESKWAKIDSKHSGRKKRYARAFRERNGLAVVEIRKEQVS